MEKFTEIMGLAPLLSIPERQLSLGQKMRCNIAAAFLHDPKIVFLEKVLRQIQRGNAVVLGIVLCALCNVFNRYLLIKIPN